MDDQRRHHQRLLLQPLVGVHIEGAAIAQREVIVSAAARRDRRSGDARHAVLLPGRRQAVPMDQARLVDLVFDADAKRLADIGGDAEGPVRLADAVNGSRLAVHLDSAALQPEDRSRRGIAGGRVLRLRGKTQASRSREGSHYHGPAGKHDHVSSKAMFCSMSEGHPPSRSAGINDGDLDRDIRVGQTLRRPCDHWQGFARFLGEHQRRCGDRKPPRINDAHGCVSLP